MHLTKKSVWSDPKSLKGISLILISWMFTDIFITFYHSFITFHCSNCLWVYEVVLKGMGRVVFWRNKNPLEIKTELRVSRPLHIWFWLFTYKSLEQEERAGVFLVHPSVLCGLISHETAGCLFELSKSGWQMFSHLGHLKSPLSNQQEAILCVHLCVFQQMCSYHYTRTGQVPPTILNH